VGVRSASLAFTDPTMKLERMPQQAIAGEVTELRRARREGAPTGEQ
jgi:hypothetical protein